jgi:hypothetical protein
VNKQYPFIAKEIYDKKTDDFRGGVHLICRGVYKSLLMHYIFRLKMLVMTPHNDKQPEAA